MKLRPDQSIHERIAVLEEALAVLLDRDETMSVEAWEPGVLAVHVFSSRWSDNERESWTLNQLARELEVLLS